MKAKQHTLIVLLVFVLAAGAALTLLTHANQKAEQAASEAEDGSISLLDVTMLRWKASPSSMAARR